MVELKTNRVFILQEKLSIVPYFLPPQKKKKNFWELKGIQSKTLKAEGKTFGGKARKKSNRIWMMQSSKVLICLVPPRSGGRSQLLKSVSKSALFGQ